MNTIKNDTIFKQEINKSEFISYLKMVTTQNDAKEYIQYVKSIHPDATHHISVYIVGKTGEFGHADDDGEPSGTAAMPIMDVFKKNNVTNFVIVVVRYFGGIKLGAGGLVRAYSSSASLALKQAEISQIIDYQNLLFDIDYPMLGIIENRLKEYEQITKSFNEKIHLEYKVPKDNVQLITDLLIGLTNNQIKIIIK